MANEGDLGHKAEEFFREAALAEASRRNQRYYFTGGVLRDILARTESTISETVHDG